MLNKEKTMRNIKLLFLSLTLILVNESWSQQESSITNYWSHMNIINPAYVASDDMINFKSTVRNQWAGISESPKTQMFSYQRPIFENVGIGLSISNDKVFIENSTFVALDFSYKLQVSEKSLLYFGMKAALDFYSINTSSLQTFSQLGFQFDPRLLNVDNVSPNVGIGFLLKKKDWYLSASIPRMLSAERASTYGDYNTVVARTKPHFYVSSGYDIRFSTPKWVLSPSFLLRSVENVPIAFDSNLLVKYNNKMSLAFTYGNTKTYAFTFGIDLYDKFSVGYSYQTSSRALLSTEWNSSELYLAYSIPYKKDKSDINPLDE